MQSWNGLSQKKNRLISSINTKINGRNLIRKKNKNYEIGRSKRNTLKYLKIMAW
jgi:hypothetical protein